MPQEKSLRLFFMSISGVPDQNAKPSTIIWDNVNNTTFAQEGNSDIGAAYTQILDNSGTPIVSFGGGTQYTDAGTPPAHPIGPTILWNNAGTWNAVSDTQPLPITVKNSSLAVTGTFWQLTQPVSLASLPALASGTNLIGQASASNETSTIYSGTTALTPSYATVVASASGATSLVSAVTSKKIRVLALYLVSNGTVNVKFQSHTTPTDLTGLAYLVANTGFVLPYNPVGWFQTNSGEQLDINLSAAIAVGGTLVYVAV